MKKLLLAVAVAMLSLSVFAQSQGVSMRATNGVAFGDTIVQNHVRATNTASTNTFAGKFQQGQGTTANGTGASAFGLGTRSSGSYSFSAGIGSINFGPGAFAAGTSNNINSSASSAFASGNKNFALDPSTFVTGASNQVAGSNSFVSGFDITMDGLSPNSLIAGQRISVHSGASNNFAWNSDPTTLLTIPADRSNSFTVTAPGGIFLNGPVTSTGIVSNNWVGSFTGNGVGLTNLPGIKNVRDFGATGNGTSDDTAAFVAAFTAAGSSNKVYVPPGNYSIHPISVTTDIEGDGPTSVLTYRDLTNGVGLGSGLLDVPITQLNTRIKNLAFFGSNAYWGLSILNTMCAVKHNAEGYGQVQDCIFNGFKAAIMVEGTNSISPRQNSSSYSQNYVTNCFYGIWLMPSNRAEYVIVNNNTIRGCNIAIYNQTAANVNIIGNNMEDNVTSFDVSPSTTGVSPNRAHSLYIGNIANHCNNPVRATDANNTTFYNNHFLGNGAGNSFTLTRTTNFVFIGNYCELTATPVTFSGGNSNFFRGNFFTSNTGTTRSGNTVLNSRFENNWKQGTGYIWETLWDTNAPAWSLAAATMIASDTATATNGIVFWQRETIPTNSIPASSSGVTNWVLLNLTNTIASGGPMYVATNLAAAGSFLIARPTLTVTAFP